MKMAVKVTEVEGEGLMGLMNERVTFFCGNYIYVGKLVGVNDTCVKLDDPAIVYETGAFNDPKWKDAQKLPNSLYIQLTAIESFGKIKE
jgi:hypothetical protein